MTFSDFGITENKLLALAVLCWLLYLFILTCTLVLFYLKGYGIYRMSQKLKIRRSWYGYVPFANVYALGRLADNLTNGRRFYRKTLTATYALKSFAMAGFMLAGLSFSVELLFAADAAALNGKELDPAIFRDLAPAIMFLTVALILKLVYGVLSAICLQKIYVQFNSKNATAKAVAGFIVPVLVPFFIFLACKKHPIKASTAVQNATGFII